MIGLPNLYSTIEMYNKVQALGISKKFKKGVFAYTGKAPDCGTAIKGDNRY